MDRPRPHRASHRRRPRRRRCRRRRVRRARRAHVVHPAPVCRARPAARVSAPVRILQVSDLHLTPGQTKKIEWVRSLAALEPDFVVNSGDNLAHVDAVPPLLRAMEPLLELPRRVRAGVQRLLRAGAQEPRALPHPAARRGARSTRPDLPVGALVEGLREGGWADLDNARTVVRDGRPRRRARRRRRPARRVRPVCRRVGARCRPTCALTMGLVHAPYQRVLDAMVADGASVVLAGHTHGGQLALPGLGRPGDELRPRHPPRQGRLPVVAGRRSAGRAVGRRARRPRHPTTRRGCTSRPGSGPRPTPRCASPAGPEATLLTLVARDALSARRSASSRRPACVTGPDRFRRPRRVGYPRVSPRPSGRRHCHGVWRSLVARVVRDDEAAGSNPVTPTSGNDPFDLRIRMSTGSWSGQCTPHTCKREWLRRWLAPLAPQNRMPFGDLGSIGCELRRWRNHRL